MLAGLLSFKTPQQNPNNLLDMMTQRLELGSTAVEKAVRQTYAVRVRSETLAAASVYAVSGHWLKFLPKAFDDNPLPQKYHQPEQIRCDGRVGVERC
ncbi:MAG: hypothetical protein QXR26_07800 [Candidatus Caldarchaeum sp.]